MDSSDDYKLHHIWRFYSDFSHDTPILRIPSIALKKATIYWPNQEEKRTLTQQLQAKELQDTISS